MCLISMSFNPIYFESLVRRGSTLASSSQKQYHTVKVLTNLDDVLGRRWYVRGLNTVGDFCYVIPGSVKYHLKYCKPKQEYQMQPNGTLRLWRRLPTCLPVCLWRRHTISLEQCSQVLSICIYPSSKPLILIIHSCVSVL